MKIGNIDNKAGRDVKQTIAEGNVTEGKTPVVDGPIMKIIRPILAFFKLS